MTLEQLMGELLDFYSIDDLISYHEFVDAYDFDKNDAWGFLNEFTLADYKLIQLVPNINNYKALYLYKQDMGDSSPYIDNEDY